LTNSNNYFLINCKWTKVWHSNFKHFSILLGHYNYPWFSLNIKKFKIFKLQKKWVSKKNYEHFGYLLILDKFALILEVFEQFSRNLGFIASSSYASWDENTFMGQTCSNNIIAWTFGHICDYTTTSLRLFWCSSFHVNNI